MPTLFQRLQHSWNAFRGRDRPSAKELGPATYRNYTRPILRTGNERSIISAIYNRIAMDVAANKFEHVRVDPNGRYIETIKDSLNDCLTIEANLDQTSRAFIQDAVLTMFDDGCVALVPIDTDINPQESASFKIYTMRVAKVTQWYPENVEIQIYDEKRGTHTNMILPKRMVAIIQNPFYAVMNEPNSTLQRLIRKLNLLDSIDEQSSAGKLDLIIQLPYVIKSEARKEQAEKRRKDIEMQLSGTKYGIAYTDGTERITQLNRPIENNLLSQIEYHMNTLFSQLGITPEILNGTADEKTMLNYNTRMIEPITSAIADEMNRKFLTKTARTQGHIIQFHSDPFKLVPVNNIADIADKFTRNEILSPNEVRDIIGFRPVDNAQADELRNRNINQNTEGMLPPATTYDENQNGSEEIPQDEYYDPSYYDMNMPMEQYDGGYPEPPNTA